MVNQNFRVWFEQINADMIDVSAKDKQSAIAKAKAEWVKSNPIPRVTDIQNK